jgi:murein DD-endopeptidase MepM/ murein hydrolase activator NlpD
VSQGQVIGRVGQTGLATGPHLHYEFRVNGVHRDPLKVRLPKALPIEDEYREDFEAKAGPLLARLDVDEPTRLAMNEGNGPSDPAM